MCDVESSTKFPLSGMRTRWRGFFVSFAFYLIISFWSNIHDRIFFSIVFRRLLSNFLSRYYRCYRQLIPYLQVLKLMYYFYLLFLFGINKCCCCQLPAGITRWFKKQASFSFSGLKNLLWIRVAFEPLKDMQGELYILLLQPFDNHRIALLKKIFRSIRTCVQIKLTRKTALLGCLGLDLEHSLMKGTVPKRLNIC